MARYADAIRWIAVNDDTEWLKDAENGVESVAAAMVADLFGKDDATVAADLRKHIAKMDKAAAARTGGES